MGGSTGESVLRFVFVYRINGQVEESLYNVM